MPPYKQPESLQEFSLKKMAFMINLMSSDERVCVNDLKPALDHIKLIVPPQLQSQVCHTILHDTNKIVYPQLFNNKHLFVLTQLQAEYLWIHNDQRLVQCLGEVNGACIKTLKMSGWNVDPDQEPNTDSVESERLHPLYTFFTTLSNLTVLKCNHMCDNHILDLLSRSCQQLEVLSVEMCTEVSDEGVFHLVGHMPTSDTFSQIRRGVRIPSKYGCRNLKKVNLEYTLAYTASAVLLLYMCSHLEELTVTPDVSFGEVFTSLHGTNPDRYEKVTCKYSLKVLHTYIELDENVLSLITKTCPHLEDVTLRCNGVERKDRNLLANLLALQIKTLYVMNCNMKALLWYLEQHGDVISNLTIQHLTMSPLSLSFSRTHLQKLIKVCPNLKYLTLKLNNSPIEPDVPYTAFGSNLAYFECLTHLTLEGISMTAEDLTVIISKCKWLQELNLIIHNSHIFDDQVLFELLAPGNLKNLKSLVLSRPVLTMVGLRRLLEECPYLHKVGPITHWGIPDKDKQMLRSEIRQKNWDLSIESPEMVNMRMLQDPNAVIL